MDLRIEQIFKEEMKGDTSFQEKESVLRLLFGSKKYSKVEIREAWNNGIKHGIEIGLRKASLEGQRIELKANTKEGKNKEFLEKFYKLAKEYKCAIQYHPQKGMIILNREYDTYTQQANKCNISVTSTKDEGTFAPPSRKES